MARGLLVSYAGYPYNLSSLFPDNGLASLAAVLISEGHECQVLDFNTPTLVDRLVRPETRENLRRLLPQVQEGADPSVLGQLVAASKAVEERGRSVADDVGRQLVERCRSERLDFVGFKLWSGDGFEASIRMAEQIAANCPDVRLFAGGPAVHYSPAIVRADAPVFDAVVNGDGEEALLELARFAEGKRDLEGIPNVVSARGSTLSNVTTDLTTLPFPAYGRDAYPSVASGDKLRLFCIDESRGCPMSCAFCVNWRIGNHGWRSRTAEQVVDEIEHLGTHHGSAAFRMTGNYTPPKLIRSVCDLIGARNLKVRFALSLYAGGVDRDLLVRLKQAGCFGVFFGVESGSDIILERAMGKRIDVVRMRSVLQDALATGLYTVGSFIFPAPFDTEETEAQTRDLIREVFARNRHSSIIVCYPGLVPHTTWWRELEVYGFRLQVPEGDYERSLMAYKIRHILPPTLWEPLSYSLAGRDFPSIARETARLQAWAAAQGICINLPDYDALIGVELGFEPSAFKQELRRLIFTGESAALRELVAEANQALGSER